mmetsp:Transcript_28299/g.93961  ORF Transcript_28299/g.93961 Transcript_28299/m.93961 type:complete len:80 (+) Transcript_28299:77-316(+)
MGSDMLLTLGGPGCVTTPETGEVRYMVGCGGINSDPEADRPDATKLPIVVEDTNGAPGRSIGIADVFAGEIGCRGGDEA